MKPQNNFSGRQKKILTIDCANVVVVSASSFIPKNPIFFFFYFFGIMQNYKQNLFIDRAFYKIE